MPAIGETLRSDAELLRASVTHPADFREVYDRHVRAVRRFLRVQVGADLADDRRRRLGDRGRRTVVPVIDNVFVSDSPIR